MCFIPYNNHNLDKLISVVLIFMLVIFDILFVVIKKYVYDTKGAIRDSFIHRYIFRLRSYLSKNR